MNATLGSGGSTLVFDSTDDEAYWYTELSYPTGDDDASIAAGAYTLISRAGGTIAGRRDKVTMGSRSPSRSSSSGCCQSS